jgi:hypothetical protein
LDKLNDVPNDIRPVFVTAKSLESTTPSTKAGKSASVKAQ